MPIVADCVQELDALVPMAKAAGWDPVGLQVGDPSAPVESIAVCHEVTDAAVEALEAEPVDLLVAYHPLLFHPVASFVAGGSAAGRAFRLARSGVAVTIVHTAFDVAPGGVADALAGVAGIDGARGFGPNWGGDTVKIVTFVPSDSAGTVAGAMADAGAGRIGRYGACSFRSEGEGTFTPLKGAAPTIGRTGAASVEPEIRLEMIAPAGAADRVVAALVANHPYEEAAYDVYPVKSNAGFIGRYGHVDPVTLEHLSETLESALETTGRVAGRPDRRVERVAVVPGSGGSFVAAAAEVADVLVTGDVSHHQARDALARGLAVVDVGHVPSERPGVARLYAAVAQLGLPVRSLLDLDPDPWS